MASELIDIINGRAYPKKFGCATLDRESALQASKYNHPASVAKRERERV